MPLSQEPGVTDETEIDRLLELLLDEQLSPEAVCDDRPGLLPAVRRRLLQCNRLQDELRTLFPPSSDGVDHRSRRPVGGPPTLAGYTIESTLGRGGMGVVYKAWQLNLNRPVALKMLLSGVCATPAEHVRFLREAHAIAALRHAHIVQVYDVGDCDGRAYFTMELIDGGTLGKKLAGQPQPAKPAAELISTLSRAIDFAHQAGVVHRDLKPGNILLSAQGVAKIADFGLARDASESEPLTLTGTPLGTPSYMAPEQALGQHHCADPAVDIYALGAILYEMLTGRPPFLAESALETQRLLIETDPVPPSRLNPRVPRDLQTICLKCLQKDPARRYASAALLADDLDRYQRGEPILARPIRSFERLTKWVVRRPATAIGIVAVVLMVSSLIGATVWLKLQQRQRETAAESDLRNMIAFENDGHWSDASASLQRAEARLGFGSYTTVRREIERARLDLNLTQQLDRIRLKRVTGGVLDLYRVQASDEYLEAFRSAHLAAVGESSNAVAAHVSASPVRLALLMAIDDWSITTSEAARRDWLLKIAAGVVPEQRWRTLLNDSAAWKNKKNLERLATSIPINSDSITLLLGLSERTRSSDRDVAPYLVKIQRQSPANFWANLILGNALLQKNPLASEGFYRAALSARPEAAVAYNAVGDSYRGRREFANALDYYQKALSLEPPYPRAVSNVAGALAGLGRYPEAIADYRRALQLDPNYVWAHFGLANALRDAGQPREAEAEYRVFIASRASSIDAINALRRVQIRQGQIQAVWADWKQVLKSKPSRYSAWAGAAELALYLDDRPAYFGICNHVLDKFGTDPATAAEIARSCLIADGFPSLTDRASAMALEEDAPAPSGSIPNQGVVPFDIGLAHYRLGEFNAAITALSGDVDRSYDTAAHLVIAMSLMKKGEPTEARQVLANAIAAFNWDPLRADRREAWIAHVLRREAESLIVPAASATGGSSTRR